MRFLHQVRGKRLPYRSEQGDKSQTIARRRKLLEGGLARFKPRPGRTIDRRGRIEQALRRAEIVQRHHWKSAKHALEKGVADDTGKLP